MCDGGKVVYRASRHKSDVPMYPWLCGVSLMAERIRRSLSTTEVQGSIPVDAHLPLHMEWIALLVKT